MLVRSVHELETSHVSACNEAIDSEQVCGRGNDEMLGKEEGEACRAVEVDGEREGLGGDGLAERSGDGEIKREGEACRAIGVDGEVEDLGGDGLLERNGDGGMEEGEACRAIRADGEGENLGAAGFTECCGDCGMKGVEDEGVGCDSGGGRVGGRCSGGGSDGCVDGTDGVETEGAACGFIEGVNVGVGVGVGEDPPPAPTCSSSFCWARIHEANGLKSI